MPISRPNTVTYKTYISLLPITWRKLRAAAEARHISGRELIQALLTQATASMPDPKPPAPPASASGSEADAYWASLSQQGPPSDLPGEG